MPTLYKGQELTKNDLKIFVRDPDCNFYNPFSITYTIYRVAAQFSGRQCSTEEPLKETIDTTPLPFGTGKFFAAWVMPKDISIGSYKIKWNIAQFFDSPISQFTEDFQIVVPTTLSADASADTNIASQFQGAWAG